MNKFENVSRPLKWSMALLLAVLLAGCGKDPILGLGGSGSGTGTGGLGILFPYGIASYGGVTNTNGALTTKINGDVVLHPTYNCNGAAVGSTNDLSACIAPNIPLNNAGDKVVTSIFPDTIKAPAVMAALTAKWNSLSPASMPGATVLGCGTIGTAGGGGAGIGCAGNATLPAGTYISATASTVDVAGILTLNGSATDVWYFQVPSALTTAVGSEIRLTGGAKASNVWWWVGSSAVLNGSTIFNGNVLASASITMGNLATSCGRLLAGAEGAGAFVLNANTVSVPGHASAPVGCQ